MVSETKKKNTKRACIGLFLGLFVLGGCGSESPFSETDPHMSSLALHKDGSVSAELVDEFGEAYYSEEELEGRIAQELGQFNEAQGEGAASLEGHGLSGSEMHVQLSFRDAEAFDAYMPEELFGGNVQGAFDAGFSFDQALAYADEPRHVIGKNELMNMADEKILILKGKMRVSVPGKILYYTQGMERTAADTLQPTEEGEYFIIYQ
ncbi:MAG: hypothetical protein K6E50_10655 [Lachnospiraceae bacterium]|nr:hypothetical protein [Lachnospiraceae bacterium]